MDLISEAFNRYCEAHTTKESEALQKLNRYTNANVLQPRMLSGHLQGRFLSMISNMMKPAQILEIGTYTGYSAICLAEGLSENGKLVTIDVNAELEQVVRSHIALAGMEHKIQFIIGDAYQVIRTLPQTWDLVFIDADKPSYAKYFDLIIDRLRPGGCIIADNVLWSGKVLNPADLAKDKDTQALDAFNKKIQADPRVENMLLPLRDGLMLIRKNA
ncbi:MAG: O-methyltransferase [Bacteroidota bacterium]|nr:O-methyltransferase [Bacteroidota bacterium]